MDTLTEAEKSALTAEANSIVKECWAEYAASGDPKWAEIARTLEGLLAE